MSSANQFKCEECGMTFRSQEELQTHSNTEHVGTAWRLISIVFYSHCVVAIAGKGGKKGGSKQARNNLWPIYILYEFMVWICQCLQ